MDKEMLDRAMAIIERHLDNTDFNVNIFAREMGMARTNLFTKLKAVTGQTPNDFILSIRLKKGAVMLRITRTARISRRSLTGLGSPPPAISVNVSRRFITSVRWLIVKEKRAK